MNILDPFLAILLRNKVGKIKVLEAVNPLDISELAIEQERVNGIVFIEPGRLLLC